MLRTADRAGLKRFATGHSIFRKTTHQFTNKRKMAGTLKDLLKYSEQAVAYMLREITHICRDMKTRAPGSEGEREAAGYMADVLRKDCGCKDVRIEPFKEHPASFYGYFYISGTIGILGIAGFFIHPLLSLICCLLGELLFLIQFVLYKKLIDPLFPEAESVNLTAIRPCTGVLRQRVFLNGHIDAAWEFPLNYHFGGVVFEIPGVASLAGSLFNLVISICALCGAGLWTHKAALWGLIFVPFFVLMALTYDPKRVVDGANDNLSGCYMGITLLRQMEELGIQLENTELGVLLTGSEEAGLRGAKAWAKAHKDDYKDVPTYIYCFDTIHDPGCLMVNSRDLNSTVAADDELCEMFLDAAREAGVPCKTGRVPLFGGSTDSAAFTQGGFRSVGITGLDHVLEDYYHTRRDTYDNMNSEGLENCYKAMILMIDMIDRKCSE